MTYDQLLNAEDATEGINAAVVNNECESSFEVLMNELKTFKNTGVNNAGGVAIIRKNGD